MKTRNKLKILRFINSNHNWRAILQASPYKLSLRDDGDYTLIKYNQIFSDFNEQMVQEARGLIIKKVGRKYIPVCVPFTKFFSYGDPNAKNALFKLAHRKEWSITQKIDGSLIKLWYDEGDWHVSTNGTIDAHNAEIQGTVDRIDNYYDLFMVTSEGKIDYNRLDKHYTYMFELISLDNKVIVQYDDRDIYYLGRRNIYTLYEMPYDEDSCIGVEKVKRPKQIIIEGNKSPKKNMREIINVINEFTKENEEHYEGYVVSDRRLKTRIKIKSPEYMNLFWKRGNGEFAPRKILLMILDSKDDDLLASFPELKPKFDRIRLLLNSWIQNINDDLLYMDVHSWEDKKSFAEWAKTTIYPSIMFSAYNENYKEDYWLEDKIKAINIDNLLKYIGADENV